MRANLIFYAKSISILFLIAGILSSCSPKETSIPIIDLSNHSGERLLHLDELINDIQVVRLETNKEVLVPQRYMSFIGEKYILILNNKNILQFDTEGNFIRILARQGKGPGEYHGIFDFDVDDVESRLFIHHWGDAKRMLGYHLDTGVALPEITLPKRDLDKFILADDYVLVANELSSSWELFTISYEGKILDTLPNLNPRSYQSYSGRSKYLKRIDGKIYYMNELSDSLYLIDGIHKSAVFYFKVDNKYDFDNLIGNLLNVSYQSENNFMLTLSKMHTEKSGEAVTTRIEARTRFLMDNKTQTIDHLSGFYHDYFEMEVKDFPMGSKGNVIHLKYSALEFKEMLTKALENIDLNMNKAIRFRELNAVISEEDNPIYLVGKIKD